MGAATGTGVLRAEHHGRADRPGARLEPAAALRAAPGRRVLALARRRGTQSARAAPSACAGAAIRGVLAAGKPITIDGMNDVVVRDGKCTARTNVLEG